MESVLAQELTRDGRRLESTGLTTMHELTACNVVRASPCFAVVTIVVNVAKCSATHAAQRSR